MNKNATKKIAYTAVLTALTVVCTLFISIPSVSGGHTNLSDAVIYIAASLIGPVGALIVGGIGTFLADIIAYPVTAVFSLVFHGLEGLISGLLIKYAFKKIKKTPALFEGLAYFAGGAIMIIGFFFAKAFYYGTMATAVVSLGRNVLQVAISIAVALIILYAMRLKFILEKSGNNESAENDFKSVKKDVKNQKAYDMEDSEKTEVSDMAKVNNTKSTDK